MGREERYCLPADFRCAPGTRVEGRRYPPPPHPLPSSGGSGTREEWRYDIAALVKAARCRKILKLKILNGDIRVRDIGGRQLSCSWWLLRSRGRRRGGEGGGRERSGGGRAALAPRVGVLYGERSRRETNEDGGDWSRKGGGETKWRDIVSRLRGHRYFKISSRARKGGGRGIHRGPRVRAHVRGVPEVARPRGSWIRGVCAESGGNRRKPFVRTASLRDLARLSSRRGFGWEGGHIDARVTVARSSRGGPRRRASARYFCDTSYMRIRIIPGRRGMGGVGAARRVPRHLSRGTHVSHAIGVGERVTRRIHPTLRGSVLCARARARVRVRGGRVVTFSRLCLYSVRRL